MKVLVWNEFYHEQHHEKIRAVYPEGMHTVIGNALKQHAEISVDYATLDMPEHGLTQEKLADVDVLIWWGHVKHTEVDDAVVQRVYERVVKDGMGIIFLHSAHDSKLFKKLCGTETGRLKWREAGERERIWVIEPNHPIAQGLPEYIQLEEEEMYGERFDIPAPDELIFISWFEGGEVFRSGCCYNRGIGRMFYFRPGHEEHPTYYNEDIQRVIYNAVRWACPTSGPAPTYGNVQPLEVLKEKK